MRLKTKKFLVCFCLFLLIIWIYNNLNYLQSKIIFEKYELVKNEYHYYASQNFDIEKNVLVFMHIQKTGGSDFDRNIVRRLLINDGKNNWNKACEFLLNKTILIRQNDIIEEDERKNKKKSFLSSNTDLAKKKIKFKKFACKRKAMIENNEQNWYFSRQTFGWICGLHPYYTELRDCVVNFYPGYSKKDFHFFTILRDPVRRYISEWQHIRRGATWKRSINQQCTRKNEYEKCYEGLENWENATLEEFVSCKYNQANNRQTRMLAYFDTKCNHLEDSVELLDRAKKTLNSMIYFALNEYQYYSQVLFEQTIGDNLFRFENNLGQSNKSIAESILNGLAKNNAKILDRIIKINNLDIQLYEYAKDLFFKRLKLFKII